MSAGVGNEHVFAPWIRDVIVAGNEAGEFDVLYERAFLCALPRRMWADWAKRSAELLRPGGLLVGFFFADDNERGPPFGLKPGELEALMAQDFDLLETRTPTDSIPVFKGKESWQVWRKR